MKVRRIKFGGAEEFYINSEQAILYNGGIGALYEFCTPSNTSHFQLSPKVDKSNTKETLILRWRQRFAGI